MGRKTLRPERALCMLDASVPAGDVGVPAGGSTSPHDGTGARRHPRIRRAAKWLPFTLLAVAAMAYLVLGAVANDRLPRMSTVDSLDVGGLQRIAASEQIEDQAGKRLDRPITLTASDGWRADITPGEAGFRIDASLVLKDIPPPGWSPPGLLRWLTRPVQVSSRIDVDTARVGAAVTSATETLTRAPREPVIETEGRGLTLVAGQAGAAVDVEQTVQAVVDAFTRNEPAAAVALRTLEPTVSTVVARGVLDSATTLLARGVLIKRDEVMAQVPRRPLARSMAFVPDGVTLRPVVNGTLLRARLLARAPQLETAARDAEFRIKEGRPVIVPARNGRTISTADLANALETAAVMYPSSGYVSLPAVSLEPELTDARASALGVRERLSAFTQEFPYAPYRVQNIGRAARYIDGTVLLPGETFSMNDTILERTREHGYTEGFVIGPGGIFREDLGGGVSAAATAVWTAAFFAGMERVETRAHSIYISRYAPGLEATVAWGVFDMRFRNDAATAVLITARTTNTSVTFEFWGTRTYDRIKAVFGPRTNIVPYRTVYDDAPTCLGQSGEPGFTIDVERRFIVDRAVVRREAITSTYQPAPRVICT